MADDKRKIIHDPIHGSISIDGPFAEILSRHEMQRLHSIKQLGLGSMVFPGANHTRFEHCLGVYHLAKRMSDVLGLGKEDEMAVSAAGMLHDICHSPFSHTMEELMERITKKDHMDLARDLIHGSIPTFMERDRCIFDGSEPIGTILEKSGISVEEVCDLISYPTSEIGALDMFGKQAYFGSKDYLHQIIHGPVDADQMDYLLRDSHYTGVTYGTIDMDRLLSQMKVRNDKMVLDKGGIVAAEGLMVSRVLMYSSVYYHKTVRIVEKMLTKAVEIAMENGTDFSEIYLMNDFDILAKLMDSCEVSRGLVRDVMFRRLYKKCYVLYSNNLSDDDKLRLVDFSDYDSRKALEEQIANKCGLDKSQVLVDVPSKSTLLSSVKVGKTDVLIDDGEGHIRPVNSFSPLARSLQSRSIFDWSMMISAPKEYKEKVERAAKNIVGIDDRVSL